METVVLEISFDLNIVDRYYHELQLEEHLISWYWKWKDLEAEVQEQRQVAKWDVEEEEEEEEHCQE